MIERLHTIPGVGLFGALFLVAEIRTIERFGSSHQLIAYAGLVPSTRSSGGKTTHGGVGHASNRWLKWSAEADGGTCTTFVEISKRLNWHYDRQPKRS
ncbi:MAG: transposase [Gemmatimonadaceae bacterium]